ncbi:tryptophan synthase alpha chain [Vulcanimicrobium alpinum]|uniref:Tryptophan synthase alpha chain n=1 Tax=Vulcanimicrobium alpinum TaxID=3016050 RepID=A0AAN1XWK9_UNVUL|nr:tryptophan synthase subunit alpha [Vulcanimicrobium alpinum]BDE06725.1 tryptophan synthase alpha chain [Vulcanimicrobium alpinum]
MIASAGIAGAFARARGERRAALIGYVVAGDPDCETSLAIVDALTAAGVDLIELGIPYGDPLADGPTIAAAGQRALAAGIKMADALAIAAEARARGAAPIVFFTYLNPIDRYGAERFARDAAAAGAAGAIVPDVPLEELASFAPPLRASGLEIPLLVAPTTPPARAAAIAAASSGFVYLVSRLGVTGAGRAPDVAWASGAIARLRETTELPIAVGFGISTPEHAAAVGAVADGVIVGSALIDAYAGARGADAARRAGTYAASLRTALRPKNTAPSRG